MNPFVLEAGIIVLSALLFWILDRYIVGLEAL
jgi:uncharacterized membrane protein